MATTKEARKKIEEVPYDHTENLTDEEMVEISKLYRLSAPIKIPVDKLSPNFEYRWVNRSQKVYRRRRGVGWQKVSHSDLEDNLALVPIDQLHMGTHTDPEGFVSLGDDLVFCKIPKRIAMALRNAQVRENRSRMSAGKRLFHETGELAGVDTFDK